jgi:RNA polymerase sigma factor (sigma-70 family)
MSPRISISLLGAQSDQRLVGLAREGHERAFEALVQRYRRPLLRYCSRMGLSETRGEDVLQQTFLQAWLALGRGVEVREPRPWLYRIAHNAAVNAIRRGGEAHGELTEAVQAGAALAAESNIERTIAVREALGEVAELPQMQRAAIFLTAVDGQTHDEVASALGISHGALRGLLYRARATLRSAAAALIPPPLLEWAGGGSGAAGPTAERLAELTGSGGATGVAGVLLKGAVVALTAGALATGAGVVASHELGVARPPRDAPATSAVTSPARLAGAETLGDAGPLGSFAGGRPLRASRGGDGHRGASQGSRRARGKGGHSRGSSPGDSGATRGDGGLGQDAGSEAGSGRDGGARSDIDPPGARRAPSPEQGGKGGAGGKSGAAESGPGKPLAARDGGGTGVAPSATSGESAAEDGLAGEEPGSSGGRGGPGSHG